MCFKNKAELIEFVRHQTKAALPNEETFMNNNRKVLYTEIKKGDKIAVLSLFQKHKIRYETHVNNNYFVYLKG